MRLAERASIGCIVACRAWQSSPTQVTVSPGWNAILPFKNCAEGPEERRTWSGLVAMILVGPDYRQNLRVAFVTDHDLGNHSRYVSGELPIYRDVKLPPNFDLLYMTTDAPVPGNINGLLIQCHKEADRVLKELKESRQGYRG